MLLGKARRPLIVAPRSRWAEGLDVAISVSGQTGAVIDAIRGEPIIPGVAESSSAFFVGDDLFRKTSAGDASFAQVGTRLRADQPFAIYIEWMYVSDPGGAIITLCDVGGHSSGWGNYFYLRGPDYAGIQRYYRGVQSNYTGPIGPAGANNRIPSGKVMRTVMVSTGLNGTVTIYDNSGSAEISSSGPTSAIVGGLSDPRVFTIYCARNGCYNIGSAAAWTRALSADEANELIWRDAINEVFAYSPPLLKAQTAGGAATLAANMLDVATQTASLSTQIPLASAALGISTMTAAANSAITASAAMVDVSTQTGALSTVISISATELSQALMNAGLATNITPAATMQDTATMQATLGGGAATLAAIMAAQAIQQANLSSQITAGAAMNDTATMGATLTVQAAFSAAMVAQSLMQSGLLTQIQAAAAMADNASMNASLSGAAATLSSAMTALSAMQGSLQTSIPVSAAMLSQALMQGGLTVSIPLAALMGDTSTMQAALATVTNLAATMTAQSAVTAQLLDTSIRSPSAIVRRQLGRRTMIKRPCIRKTTLRNNGIFTS